jgi:hypothetical protein
MRTTYKLKDYVTNIRAPINSFWHVHDDVYKPIWQATADLKGLLLSSSEAQEDQPNDRSPPKSK